MMSTMSNNREGCHTSTGYTGGVELDPKSNLVVNEYRGPGECYQRDLPPNSDGAA